MNKRTWLWGVLLFVALSGGRAAAGEPAASVPRGKLVYERYCISCHGAKGNGQGEFAEWIAVKPRDYRQGVFMWRSTPSDSLPTDEDLERTLINGIYGTYMPTWKAIGHRARRDVIAYIKTFSPRFATQTPGAPIAIPVEPRYTVESVARGKAEYKKLNCSQCHGENGQGDGPSAHELKDDWGNQLVPADLTFGHVKCGDKGSDIYRVFMTGLSGSPMPAFSDSVTPDEAWDLVHFIQSLSPAYEKNVQGTTGGGR